MNCSNQDKAASTSLATTRIGFIVSAQLTAIGSPRLNVAYPTYKDQFGSWKINPSPNAPEGVQRRVLKVSGSYVTGMKSRRALNISNVEDERVCLTKLSRRFLTEDGSPFVIVNCHLFISRRASRNVGQSVSKMFVTQPTFSWFKRIVKLTLTVIRFAPFIFLETTSKAKYGSSLFRPSVGLKIIFSYGHKRTNQF